MKDKTMDIIKKITIAIGEVDAELTPKQAKALHEALGDLLGLNKPVQLTPVVVRDNWHPYWPYGRHIWCGTMTGTTPAPDKWTVNYSANSGVASLKM